MTTGQGTILYEGARVITADGKQLGMVKESRTDRFHVDVRWAPDYWLGKETIETSDREIVQLTLTKQEVGASKLHNEVKGPGVDNSAEDYGGPAPQNRPPPTL